MFGQRKSVLDWQVADDEQTWQHLAAANNRSVPANGTNRQSKQRSKLRHRFLSVTVLALVLVSLLGIYLHNQAKTGRPRWPSELETAVEVESWAASNSSQAVLREVLDPAAPTAWRNRILWEHEQTSAAMPAYHLRKRYDHFYCAVPTRS